MFKSCCARPSKKISNSKSKSENLTKDSASVEKTAPNTITTIDDLNNKLNNESEDPKLQYSSTLQDTMDIKDNTGNIKISKDDDCDSTQSDNIKNEENKDNEDSFEISTVDLFDQLSVKQNLTKKRYSIDYKTKRHDFKRYSFDCRNDSVTLDELSRLEKELARTNLEVRPPRRRKSVGILKSTTSYSDVETQLPLRRDSLSEDDDVFEKVTDTDLETEGPRDPPATPVGRDELALRRHRFFSDLVCAARAAVEHRVRFDPLGPIVADTGKIKKNIVIFLSILSSHKPVTVNI